MSAQRLYAFFMTLAFCAVIVTGVLAQGEKSKSDKARPAVGMGVGMESTTTNAPGLDGGGQEEAAEASGSARRQSLAASLTIFVLAVFVGFEVITKVPPTLHTPLMSGSNAISGITLVGALLVTGVGLSFSGLLGFAAVVLASINVVGGFLVTHRMLAMFKKR